MKKKKGINSLALVVAVVFLLSGAVSFIQPKTALADDTISSHFTMMNATVGETFDSGRIYYSDKKITRNSKTYEVAGVNSSVSISGGAWDGLKITTGYNSDTDEYGRSGAYDKITGTPKKAGKYVFTRTATVTYKSGEDTITVTHTCEYSQTVVEKEIDDDDDDDDDDSSSSGMSYEEKQREAARHFAPDASTMTAEQSAGWGLVSREAPAVSSSTGGVSAVSAYQGPMCRLAFQLAAPGYNIGHTYDMSFANKSGNVSMKVPSDLAKSGRRFVLSFVIGGRYVTTPALTADANGNINFNLATLGLNDVDSNAAMAVMYQD